ncbi:hypothetical protein VNO78_22855 [Psophocarpus tetragonolobus]|uniref:Uncharacterized protein n=1 Tax=Psophocarpus tetragonolobus TaxID=3891 RepID=A0AAN9S2Q5_PSOTE
MANCGRSVDPPWCELQFDGVIYAIASVAWCGEILTQFLRLSYGQFLYGLEMASDARMQTMSVESNSLAAFRLIDNYLSLNNTFPELIWEILRLNNSFPLSYFRHIFLQS